MFKKETPILLTLNDPRENVVALIYSFYSNKQNKRRIIII